MVFEFGVAVGDDAAADGQASTKVTLGTVGASDPYWQTFEDAAAKEGIDLEVKDFADYAQLNPALSEGELDVNQFQHLVYLSEYNTGNDADLAPLGSTAIYPLALYSSKVDSVEDIEQGDTVVPDAGENKTAAIPVPSTGTAAVPTSTPSNANDETAWIHIRAVISSPEAATIIGKGGENVSNIRKQSGAKCTVSDYQKGAVERILTVSGVVDAVAKVSINRIASVVG